MAFMRLIPLLVLLFTLFIALHEPMWAHGFGERYDLPIPLGYYVFGGGSVVALSFLVTVFSMPTAESRSPYAKMSLLQWNQDALYVRLFGGIAAYLAKILGVLILVVVIVGGFWGQQDVSRNIAPSLIWIGFWVGLIFIVALFGNLWSIMNPWNSIFASIERVALIAGLDRISRNRHYPSYLNSWPAVLFFGGFAWFELVDPRSSEPDRLAIAVLAYSMVTFTGMWWFGRVTWLKNAEVFSILFDLLASLAPFHLSTSNKSNGGKEGLPKQTSIAIRWWGAGLLEPRGLSISIAVLIVFWLSSVTFDGLTETPFWSRINTEIITAFPESGSIALRISHSIGIVLSLIILFGLVVASAFFTGLLSNQMGQTSRLVSEFAYLLIPIAMAYHIAHYFSFLLIQGQLLIPLLSDPLGMGWDLFNTGDYRINIGVTNARMAWLIGVFCIIIGHCVTIILSHKVIKQNRPTSINRLRSNLPMLVLAVAYSMLSLWILAQPITEY